MQNLETDTSIYPIRVEVRRGPLGILRSDVVLHPDQEFHLDQKRSISNQHGEVWVKEQGLTGKTIKYIRRPKAKNRGYKSEAEALRDNIPTVIPEGVCLEMKTPSMRLKISREL